MDKWEDYIIRKKAYFFTFGLLCIISLIDMVLVEILFSNIIKAQQQENVRVATIIVNIREGATELLKVVSVIFTRWYMKGIGGVILFNVIYIAGLVVLYLSKHSKTTNLIVAAILISLGKTGFVLLISFINDLLRKTAKERVQRQKNKKLKLDEDLTTRFTLVWWVIPWVLAASIAPFIGFWGISVTKSIVLFTSLFVVALGIFCAGDCLRIYKDRSSSDSSDEDRSGEDSTNEYIYEDENQGHQHKATIKEVLKIILVWISLILHTIVAAAGTTFFLQQAYFINKDFPVVTFLIFKHIANVSISVRYSKRGNNLFTHLAVGTLFSLSSSVFGFWTEAIAGGIWLLTFQYVFSGAAEGLARDAFEGYFRDRIRRIIHTKNWILDPSKVKYAIQIFVMLGKVLSNVTLSLALGFSVLDANDLRSYYKLLMVASSASLLVSLYLRFNEKSIFPIGLTSDLFIQSGGLTPMVSILVVSEPSSSSPKSKETHPHHQAPTL